MNRVFKIVKDLYKDFDERHAATPFEYLSIDSFDLMTIRMNLEVSLGLDIPDQDWVGLQSFADVENYFEEHVQTDQTHADLARSNATRRVRINMPQMAIGGLSESWLFKELGDMHWMMICDALKQPSHGIQDELGNRLYATFVRIRLEMNHHLKSFEENEEFSIENHLSRFGKSMFFSDCVASTATKKIRAAMMSTFALRQESDNRNLLKGAPSIPSDSKVHNRSSMPKFAAEYREVRNGAMSELELMGESFKINEEMLHEEEYAINPYQDFNGVNLLYFAAYPLIHDICERRFVHAEVRERVKDDWALETSTVAREVFYFANCNMSDFLRFQVNSFEFLPNGRLKIASSIRRNSDHLLLARLFTIKECHG